MVRRCRECGRESPDVFAGLCRSCTLKKAGVKPLGQAIIEPTAIEPKPAKPKPVRETRSLTDIMARKGWR